MLVRHSQLESEARENKLGTVLVQSLHSSIESPGLPGLMSVTWKASKGPSASSNTHCTVRLLDGTDVLLDIGVSVSICHLDTSHSNSQLPDQSVSVFGTQH